MKLLINLPTDIAKAFINRHAGESTTKTETKPHEGGIAATITKGGKDNAKA